jgi:hypothetical protein
MACLEHLQETLYIFKNRDLVKNYPPTASSIGYINIDLYFGFLASQRWRARIALLRTRYRKAVEEYKDIENDFYSKNSLNDDLESRF